MFWHKLTLKLYSIKGVTMLANKIIKIVNHEKNFPKI